MLFGLLDVMHTNHIPVPPYKGPTLAAQAYGDIGLRQFSDLDVLVHRHDVWRAVDALVSDGYRPEWVLSRGQRAAYLHSQCEYVLMSPEGVPVEIHWHVVPPFFHFRLDSEQLWARSQLGDFLGRAWSCGWRPTT